MQIRLASSLLLWNPVYTAIIAPCISPLSPLSPPTTQKHRQQQAVWSVGEALVRCGQPQYPPVPPPSHCKPYSIHPPALQQNKEEDFRAVE